jgi:hypothetical protein
MGAGMTPAILKSYDMTIGKIMIEENPFNSIYEFGMEYSQTYKSLCNNCGREIEVSTQKNHDPEYYTEIHVRCICGGSAKFRLPVN